MSLLVSAPQGSRIRSGRSFCLALNSWGKVAVSLTVPSLAVPILSPCQLLAEELGGVVRGNSGMLLPGERGGGCVSAVELGSSGSARACGGLGLGPGAGFSPSDANSFRAGLVCGWPFSLLTLRRRGVVSLSVSF